MQLQTFSDPTPEPDHKKRKANKQARQERRCLANRELVPSTYKSRLAQIHMMLLDAWINIKYDTYETNTFPLSLGNIPNASKENKANKDEGEDNHLSLRSFVW